MFNVLMLLWFALTGLFRSKARLEAEILVLRQQINVLRRKSSKRAVLGNFDRLVFVGAPRVHGELLKLGIDVGLTSVAKYMAGARRGPSQGLEDLSLQSRRRHRLGGPVRRPDGFFPAAVWLSGATARSTSNHVAGSDGKPDS